MLSSAMFKWNWNVELNVVNYIIQLFFFKYNFVKFQNKMENVESKLKWLLLSSWNGKCLMSNVVVIWQLHKSTTNHHHESFPSSL
jgi:hypothetical protein